MSISNLYLLGPIVTGGGQINQIQDYKPDWGIQELLHCGDGQVDYQFAAVAFQAPKLDFTTTALARALAIAGINGYSIAAAFDFYFQKIAQGGTRTGGASSVKMSGAKGMLVPMSISCQDNQPARLDLSAQFVSSDGAVVPLAQTSGQTMPTITATDQVFFNGPISANGTLIEGVKDTQIEFGLELIVEHGSGEGYPTFVGIRRRQPRITFKTTDVTTFGSSNGFVAQGATDSAVYLRKLLKNGLRTPDATAEHIKIAIDDGLLYTRTIGGGSDDDPQMTEGVFVPTWDGTNDVLAISTASAIT